jgi:hypothetical protein
MCGTDPLVLRTQALVRIPLAVVTVLDLRGVQTPAERTQEVSPETDAMQRKNNQIFFSGSRIIASLF